uniref:Predicted protein n=1 Tax=Hordeum vulgare subsp. vulgare TaxID=112509 RepID=F2EHH1_HORVV|nr:predicted protein [Hordeum vulgare subsp. vulgare]
MAGLGKCLMRGSPTPPSSPSWTRSSRAPMGFHSRGQLAPRTTAWTSSAVGPSSSPACSLRRAACLPSREPSLSAPWVSAALSPLRFPLCSRSPRLRVGAALLELHRQDALVAAALRACVFIGVGSAPAM